MDTIQKSDLDGLEKTIKNEIFSNRTFLQKIPEPQKRVQVKGRGDWTKEEDALLLKGVDQGLSYSQITAWLPGRTRNACIGRYKRLRTAAYAPRKDLGGKRVERPHKTGTQILIDCGPKLAGEEFVVLPQLPVRWEGPSKSIVDLGYEECRYPVQDRLFCAGPIVQGSSYCADHKAVCTARPVK